MANGFSGSVEKIVDNYLEKLKKSLRGIPAKDQEELTKEIHSHIYESFRLDPTENEIDRILKVLDKLGDPAEVISSRVSPAMVDMGKKRKLPFYILAGTLIALFGVPLGLGGVSVLIGLIMAVLALVASYYILAFTLVLTGWLCALTAIIRLFYPDFLEPYVQIYPLLPDPTLNLVIYILGSLLIAALGIGMFVLGKHMMRGIRFAFRTLFQKIRGLGKGKKREVAPRSESV